MPDLAIATMNDFVQVSTNTLSPSSLFLTSIPQSAQMVCSLDPTTPVIADADTGQVYFLLNSACFTA